MKLNAFGRIAWEEWQKLPERFPNIELDEFQVMPNHMHGIIAIINESVGASLADAHLADAHLADAPDVKRAPARGAPTVGDMIGAYKSLVADKCLELWKSKRSNQIMGKLWQRNFYEHIIRNERSLNNIRKYIMNNPEKWETDSENRC